MNAIIPNKRRDGQTSFADLVAYVAVRDEESEEDLMLADRGADLTADTPHRSRFERLVDYATRLRDESLASMIDIMPDGGEWVNFYGVTCFHNCMSVETAADEMEQVASKARFAHSNSDPVFHYILSWQSHESPRPEQIYDSVRHTLKSMGMGDHQYVSAVHTDTDNLHVHVAVNRVHPQTGYLNRLAWSQEKLSKACRELELKHGFSPDNGCFVHAPGNRIVRRAAIERDRLSAWQRGKTQTLQQYIAATSIASLRAEPAHDWLSFHQRLAQDGLFLMQEKGEFTVRDGWDRTRQGVEISAFGPSWSSKKMIQRMGAFTLPPVDIFQKATNVGRYDPARVISPERPEKIAESESLSQYASRHLYEPLSELARSQQLYSVHLIHQTLAKAGLFLDEQHGKLVICDGYNRDIPPVRAERIWPLLTINHLSKLEGGWQAVPADIFQQYPPEQNFSGRKLECVPVTNSEWHRMRTGPGPQGAIKREIFSDKESLWGYAVSHCSREIEALITSGQFNWQRCHETFARQGLILTKEHNGFVVMDAFNQEQTPVKASSVHPDLTPARATPQAGPFEKVSVDIFERIPPEGRYNPELAVSDRGRPETKRDPELRRQRREARAEARSDLHARYLAWRDNWTKPDLRYGERCREIHQECRMKKAHARVQFRDPMVRKLHYHIAEVQRMQALIRLKEEIKEERKQLVEEGKWYPLSFRQWVEQEGLKGDRAAISQLRGWDYRDRRKDSTRATTQDRCVVLCEPGGSPVYRNIAGLDAHLQKNGSVRFRDTRTGKHVCTDYGDRVVFRNSQDYHQLKHEMVRVSPVLFGRDPRFGFAPQGEDQQFNNAFADMVAWHNVSRASAGYEYQISRVEVDERRQQSEQSYRKLRRDESSLHGSVTEQKDDWKPPSPF